MFDVKQLRSTLPQTGSVAWLGASDGSRSTIRPLSAATFLASRGIAEDYHAKSGRSKRQVTLVQQEHLALVGALLDRAAIRPEEVRRNVVVAGVNLLALRGARFRIGEALLEATGPCAPCSRMEENLGPGGYNAMRGHGGITAIVLSGGDVKLGDCVEFVELAADADPD
jgi:MOSC domain-containing protein YiiM